MDKPTVNVETVKVKKFLKNGTFKVENHYKTDYELNTITISAFDAFDQKTNSDLNKASTLYEILTNGGYTALSNDIGSSRSLLRFPTFSILEIRPSPVRNKAAAANAIASSVGAAATSLFGGGFSSFQGSVESLLDATNTGLNFLNPFVAGVYTLQDPVITTFDFGNGINYSSDGFVQVSFTVAYNNFKYEKAVI